MSVVSFFESFLGRKDPGEAERYKILESAAAIIGEYSESALSTADLDLAMDDRGWLRFGGSDAPGEIAYATRKSMVAKSRLYWHRDPLVKQAVRIWTDYSVNTGVTFQVQDNKDAVGARQDRSSRVAKATEADGDPQPPIADANATADSTKTADAQKKLETFWNDRRNRGLTSREGQRKSSKRLLVDGEVFFACLDIADGKVVRRIDALEITDFIKDPDDSESILAFRRAYLVNNKEEHKYYRNLMITDEEFDAAIDKVKGPNSEPVNVEKDVLLYHIPFDALKDRGNPLASASIDWAREHRRFMESRVAIVQALAKYAHKITLKGGQKQVDAMVRSLQSGLVSGIGNGIDKNPVPAAGSNWISNEAVSLDQMPRSTGGGDSRNDGDQLKLMHCAGTGIMLHYFGDPSTGNLATATTMELPMLKQFEAYQAQWSDVWRDIFAWVLGEDPSDEEARTAVDIDYPYMVQKDLNILASAITSFTQSFPELKIDAIMTLILTSLGINNVDDVLDMIEMKRQELEQKQAVDAQTAHANALEIAKTQGVVPPPVPGKPLAEALEDLARAMTEATS